MQQLFSGPTKAAILKIKIPDVVLTMEGFSVLNKLKSRAHRNQKQHEKVTGRIKDYRFPRFATEIYRKLK